MTLDECAVPGEEFAPLHEDGHDLLALARSERIPLPPRLP